MRGIVVHYAGGIRRATGGRAARGRLFVSAVLSVAPPPSDPTTRPVTYVFYEEGRIIAKSSRVILMKGRRYPGVEHWFVLPEERPLYSAAETARANAAV